MRKLKVEEVEKFIAGDDTIFPKIFAEYRNKVNYMALSILHNEADCEEVVQNTFIRVFEKRDNLKDASAFNTWIYRIAHNISLDLYRKNKRNLSSDHYDVEELSDIKGHHSTEYEMKKNTIRESIQVQIGNLPDDLKEVCNLWFLSDCTLEEIAQILELPKGTVKSRLHRAKRQLRSDLRRNEITPSTFLAFSFPTFAFKIYMTLLESQKLSTASNVRVLGNIESATKVPVSRMMEAITNNILTRSGLGIYALVSLLALGGLGMSMNSDDQPIDTTAKNIQEIMYLKEKTNKSLQIGILFDGDIKEKDISILYQDETIKLDVVDQDRCTFIAKENGVYTVEYKTIKKEIEINNIDKTAPSLVDISVDDGIVRLSVEDDASGVDFEMSYVKSGDKEIPFVQIDDNNLYLGDILEEDAYVRLYDKTGNYENYEISVSYIYGEE